MRQDLIFSLDIGTRTIIGIVGEYNSGIFNVLAHAVREHKERNMYDGQIHDIEGVAKTAQEIIKELEEKTGEKLKIVSIAAAGRALKTHKVTIEQEVNEFVSISKLDVETLELEAVQKAQREINQIQSNENSKYYCIGYTVVDYFLDGEIMGRLDGHKGNKIGVELLSTFLPQIVIESLYSVITILGLEVGSITLEPIAAINMAVKQELRLLNLALVDIGAGTSDIAITKDGQITSYAMTSTAGDEITERLAKAYLLDFNSSEKLKIELSKKEEHEFVDIVGMTYKLSTSEIVNNIIDIIDKIAREITGKILEYNVKPPNAVFLIGGSSQMPLLKERIAERLGLPKERVSIRDISFIENVIGLDKTNGPEMITPIGIAMEGAKDKYKNFLKVVFNGEEVRIFNTEDIKVSDILILTGYNPRDLIAKDGDSFVYYLNGKKRIIKGTTGTPPQILVDGKISNIRTQLNDNSIIEILPSITEPISPPYLYDQISLDKTLNFLGNSINLIKEVKINDEVVNSNTILKDGDNIQVREIRTLKELLIEYSPESNTEEFLINGKIKTDDYLLMKNDYIIKSSQTKKNNQKNNKSIKLVINDEEMEIYYSKDKFIFVDIFDHIDFDLSTLKGILVLKVNDRDAEYMEELKDGDNIKIYWD